MVKWKLALFLGIASGLILGFFLKVIEVATGNKVYTLLLNVDFVPILGAMAWHEAIEFLFHLLFSIGLSILFVFIISRYSIEKLSSYLFIGVVVTLPTVFLYFPLVLLAQKDVPTIKDVESIFYWSTGHLLYGLSLGLISYHLKKHSQ
ncbi:hypothetical protein LS684_07440 [Cytobacillus spongiae]|uniref:hypothetical protein n=1 Tax=Cytobacillus spongiae TaxID=2901381 RepID=UPI001F3E17F1|nr:hypothetical protein [Cytobacillus spongiae]UII57265.1 hypothetical protein LS684_07440 [Cytobacillus spongiae]